MKLSVKCEVTIGDGAKVVLSGKQQDSLHKFVEGMILNGSARGLPKKAVLGARRWTPEEVEAIIAWHKKAEHPLVYTDIARQLGRTPAAVQGKLWQLAGGGKLP